jgi:predicted signal transduction protein with EAL and GGDEF domain
MRSSGDLVLLAQPSWLTVRHLTFLVFLLLLAVIAVGTRVWFVERTMRSQVVALGYIEQRRGRILEAINSSQPLAETLEQITELASVVLKGAPCWCQIADGATLGNYPQRPGASGLRIVEHPIGSHSGPPLGSIFAAFDAHVIPQAAEAKSLSMAAALAALAIETRRLYSDLVRRSEFDMLTDVHNRFSLEKNLDAHIQIARQTAGVFGLIYPLSGS